MIVADTRKTLLVTSHVFVPDPAAVGQYVAEVAFEMVRRGHRVVVLTGDRGYDDPSIRYPSREIVRGVEVIRLPLTSFGKKAIPLRIAGTASFMLQSVLHGLLRRKIDGFLFSTTPPLIGVANALAGALRGVPIAYWAMDLNPDQLVALGKLSPTSPITTALDAVNRFYLDRSALVVALDRFMIERLQAKTDLGSRGLVVPPWPLEDLLASEGPIAHAENTFRRAHGLEGRVVIMYSGNHTPSNPLDTLIASAIRLRDDPELRFVFVGGGAGKAAVQQAIGTHGLRNVVSLPYQALVDLPHSLSAADVHVVSLGDAMVGIVHPSKVYGAMAVGRPILYFGPRRSHVGDLLDEANIGLHVAHGDVDGAVEAIRRFQRMSHSERAEMGAGGRAILQNRLGREGLSGLFCDRLESSLGFRSGQVAKDPV